MPGTKSLANFYQTLPNASQAQQLQNEAPKGYSMSQLVQLSKRPKDSASTGLNMILNSGTQKAQKDLPEFAENYDLGNHNSRMLLAQSTNFGDAKGRRDNSDTFNLVAKSRLS